MIEMTRMTRMMRIRIGRVRIGGAVVPGGSDVIPDCNKYQIATSRLKTKRR